MDKVFDEVLASLAFLVAETGARVSRGPLPTVVAERIQLAQVLQNLIENAIKYHRFQPPEVRGSCVRQDGQWIFTVADNGIGLALCRRIIERHGGRMWLESEAGRGSEFFFSLPAER